MRTFSLALFMGLFLSISSLQAAPVDLSTWTAESYSAVAGFPSGLWGVSGGGSTVLQTANGQPTMFYSDFNAMGTNVTGTIQVSTSSDDDYIGFALGFQPGDSANASASYLLVDWKRNQQSYNFAAPSNTPGSIAYAGLAVSRVTGTPTADEFWGHVNFVENPSGGLTELARGNTLGTTGWARYTDYVFSFNFLPTGLQVSVNGTPELNIAGSFSNGRMAFYNFSQAGVTYSAFEVQPVPEPGTMILMGLGLLGLVGYNVRRRKQAL